MKSDSNGNSFNVDQHGLVTLQRPALFMIGDSFNCRRRVGLATKLIDHRKNEAHVAIALVCFKTRNQLDKNS